MHNAFVKKIATVVHLQVHAFPRGLFSQLSLIILSFFKGFFLNFCVFPSLQQSKQLHKRIIIKFQLDQVLNIPIQYQVQQLGQRQQQLLLQPQYYQR